MPTNRITMRRIQETLRLPLHAGLSHGEIARALKVDTPIKSLFVRYTPPELRGNPKLN